MKVMNKKNQFLGILLLSILLSGCSGLLDQDEYVQWVRDYDNGLHVSKRVGVYNLDVQYQPARYVQLQKMSTGSYHETNANEKGSEEIQYYSLTVGLADKNVDFINYDVRDIAEKQRKQYYFSYRFQDDITLEEDGEELPCVLYHFERPVDLRGSRTILLGFEQKVTNAQEATLKITSDQFGSLPVRIKVSKANIPDVKL